MINAVSHMLNSIYHQIPKEILELAFEQKGNRVTLDECIIDRIIEGRIRPEVSAIAGQAKEIVLDPSWATMSGIDSTNVNDPNASPNAVGTIPYVVYRVPQEYREHRSIVAVSELSIPYGSSSSIAMMGGASSSSTGCNYSGVTAMSIAQQALNGVTGNNNILQPTPILLADNHIKLTPMQLGMFRSYSLVLKCRIEYDKDFTNLTPNAVLSLGKLGVAATKAYIHNVLDIVLDQGAMMSGQEIGKIRERVESYADQNERYEVLCMEFHGNAEVLDINTLRDQILLGIIV